MIGKVRRLPPTDDLRDRLAEQIDGLDAGVVTPAQANAVTLETRTVLATVGAALRVARTLRQLDRLEERIRREQDERR